MFKRLIAPSCALIASLAVLQPAQARIKLITLPERQRVEVQLDNPNATLVEEERIVPLLAGTNQIDFSWANTAIDSGSILFRVIGPVEGKEMKINVLSVSYPPNENALVWQVSSSESGSARVRISYVLGNLSKSFNYRAIAAKDETTLDLQQYIRIANLANESFGSTGLWAGFGPRFLKPIGLNETKEMLMQNCAKVPITKTYTCNPAEFDYLDRAQNKLRVPMHYVLKNDKANQMGLAPLQYGKVRIFQDDGKGTTAFTGEDWGKFTPIDDEMKLYLGVAQDIVVKRTIARNQRQRIAGNLNNLDVVIQYEIENFKDKPVTLDVTENIPFVRSEIGRNTGRDVEWKSGDETTLGALDATKTTVDTAVFHVKLPARGADGKAEKVVQKFQLIIKNEW